MAQLIKIKSGSAAPASASLLTGEPAYSINDNRLYIGNGSSVVRVDAGSYTGECSTAAATAEKTVSCTGFILFKGVEITVKFTVDNTAAVSALTLNVGSTLAKPIRYRGTYLLSPSTLSKNRVYKFYYDGNNWELIGDLDTDTTVGAALTDHINKVNNPHAVTKAQVGLGNVDNVKQATQSDIDTAIDELEIGGRNLYKESATIKTYGKGSDHGNVSSWSNIVEDGVEFTRLTPKNNGNFYFYPKFHTTPFSIKSGEQYVVSFKYRTTQTSNIGLYNYLLAGGVSAQIPPSLEWQTFSKTYTVTADKTTSLQLFGFANLVAGQNLDIKNLKLEKGTKPTDWTPAPEDQVSDWSTTDVTSFSYIKNKPTQLSQFTDNIGVALHIANTSNPHSVTKAQVGLGSVENTTLSTWAGSTAIATLGTIDTGTWNATTIAVGKGGTGKTSIASGKMLYASAANTYAEVTTSSFGRGLLNTSSGTLVSGLNADLLDGRHSYAYVQSDVKAVVTSPVTYDFNAFAGNAITWLDHDPASDGSNVTYENAPWTSSVPGGGWSSIFFKHSAYGTQLAFLYNTSNIKYRNKRYSGGVVWNDWLTLYSSGNTNKTTVDWSAKNLTLAGAITGATTITASSTIQANRYIISSIGAEAHLQFNRASANYITAPASGYFVFQPEGGVITTTNSPLMIKTASVAPGSTNVTSIGLSNNRWSNVYSVLGNFSSNLTVGGTLGVTGATTLSTAYATKYSAGYIWNSASGGYTCGVDGALNGVSFFNGSDTSARIYRATNNLYINRGGVPDNGLVMDSSGNVTFNQSISIPTAGKYLQIGSARFTYEVVEGVGFLKLAHSNGSTPMHLVTTGGQTMYSTGVPATGGGGGSGTLVFLNGSSIASETAYIYSPTSIGYPGYILKAANPSGLPVWDSISNLLPDASTSVKGVAKLSGSGSATTVARSDHNHTGVYANASHSHSGYALTSHNHYSIGDQYTALLLTGTTVTIHTDLSPRAGFWKSGTNGELSVDTNTYALSSHNHTGVYAPITHSHNYLSSDAANTSDLVFAATNGLGITFWNNAANFKITMTHISDTVYGGRIAGENSSDWNMYFHLYSGEGMMYNRGFVFQSNKTDKLMAINPSGIISNVGMTFNSGTIKGAVIGNYGVCSTAASTGAKTVTISGFRLATGVQINVKFSNNNYAYPITLNVSGTGAKTVKAYGDNDEQYFLEQIQAGAVVPFVYDGTYWVIPTTPSMY